MSGDFLDSNVILYLYDDVNLEKQQTARETVLRSLQEGTGCISFQVVQEVLNGLTTKVESRASADDARRVLNRILLPLWHVMPGQALYERSLGIQERFRYRFYDSLIIAAALDYGCTRLLSEDMQAGQVIEGLTIVNPFANLQN